MDVQDKFRTSWTRSSHGPPGVATGDAHLGCSARGRKHFNRPSMRSDVQPERTHRCRGFVARFDTPLMTSRQVPDGPPFCLCIPDPIIDSALDVQGERFPLM